MIFSHAIHNHVLQVLRTLNHDFLASCEVYFGGGTMLALCYGEYRLSRDIDFLCPYGSAFSRLRVALYDHGYAVLFDSTQLGDIHLPQEIRTDRDGVRFVVQVGEQLLKVEIVAEGRIDLEAPIYPVGLPVPCLSVVDQIAEKLLANGDRWPDTATDSRDLIDLSILRQLTPFPAAAITKAEAAYRCIDPLKRSILNFQAKPDYRSRCYERLGIQTPATIITGLDQLAMQFGLPLTERMPVEQLP
jgi:predicted nucleotidyltransferase component of viral defense system